MWQSLHDAWWRLATDSHPHSFIDRLTVQVLHAGASLYGGAVALRNAAYDRGWARQVALPCRVVSIGNLTVGGTGKTACAELIARQLTDMSRRVAILSRGYGGARRDYWLRWDGHHLMVNPVPQAGLPWCGVNGRSQAIRDDLADEPQLLARHLAGVPVVVGPRRDRTGAFACREFSPDVVILDDGFQHRRLRRDCDIVLVHARMPFGGFALLPSGPMREPLQSVARAHVIIVTKADEALETIGALSERLRALNPDAALVTAVHAPSGLVDVMTEQPLELSRLSGLSVGLLSSIGDPLGFEATVERLHATIRWHRSFPDHHRYAASDWQEVAAQCRAARPEAIITTEKDWVRLQPLVVRRADAPAPIWMLQVKMAIVSGKEALHDRLARL